MPPRRPAARLAACAVACLTAVLVMPWAAESQTAPSPRTVPMGAMDMGAAKPGATDHPADEAFTGAMTAMMAAMDRTPLTGRTDEDFVRTMIPHHQAAVVMAEAELAHGTDPALKAMARDIIAAQGRELAAMRAWLARAGR